MYPRVKDDKDDRLSQTVLGGLENIDDDLGKRQILIVKMSSADNEFSKLDVHELPAVVFFENKVPKVFQGKLKFQLFFAPLTRITYSIYSNQPCTPFTLISRVTYCTPFTLINRMTYSFLLLTLSYSSNFFNLKSENATY